MTRRSLSAFVLAAAVAASGVAVFAHMKATKMEPAADSTLSDPPTKIQVWFTQAPDPKVSKLDLEGAGGAVKLTGFQVTGDKAIAANVDGALTDGKYTVRWQSAGDDGHVQKGGYAFTVRRTR
jgi:methionine-rich copper-binding protein CopC